MRRSNDTTGGPGQGGGVPASTTPDGRMSRRRGLLLAATGLAGLAVGAGATEAGNLASAPSQVMAPVAQIPSSEALMREHGVLKRLLLVYREATTQLQAGHGVPADALHQAADVMHTFIHGFHEGMEEGYVFPPLRRVGKQVDTVNTLLVQHGRGRQITQRVLAATAAAGMSDPSTRTRLAEDLAAFVRMYEPHEAREDTVVFPAFRAITPGKRFAELAERFAELHDKQFGPHGFTNIVNQVAEIERRFGIDNLAQFTPRV
jgi:hemerythrin-like domain-containing protein